MHELLDYSGADNIITSDEMRALLSTQHNTRRHMDIGLGRLNSIVQGIESGELIAIGGPTKHGKTLLCQTITRNLAEQGHKSLWFSFEVPVVQFLRQIPESVSFLLPKELRQKDMSWILDRMGEAKVKYDCSVVFIDNLHHLVDLGSSRNVSLDIGVTIRLLKRIALGLDIVIFILCHSKKPYETKGLPPEPSEWDLRDSSFIPQESDTTWMIQRCLDASSLTNSYTTKSRVKVCNHRRTGAMNEVVPLVKIGQSLEEDLTHE